MIGVGLFYAVLALGVSTPEQAKGDITSVQRCELPTAHEWLVSPTGRDWRRAEALDPGLVKMVSLDVAAEAAQLLEKADAVPLSVDQVLRFVGAEPGDMPADMRPYLVRAVFPSPNVRVSVERLGDDLNVFAGGLGCFPYKKRPVIVYLDRAPDRIFVSAAAAL